MEIDRFLEEQAGGGSSLETSEFTIDQARALEKLSESLLPDPALWVVKMVQAAVSGDAEAIDFKFERNRFEVCFESARLTSAREIFELAVSGQLVKDPFLLHLTTGMRAGSGGEGVSFTLEVSGVDGLDRVEFDGERFAYSSGPEVGSTRIARFRYEGTRPSRTLALGEHLFGVSLRDILLGASFEEMALLAHCWPSPIPVRIDGKAMDCRYDSRLMSRGMRNPLGVRQWMSYLVRYFPAEPEQPTLRVDQYTAKHRHPFAFSTGQTALMKESVYSGDRFLDWCWELPTAGRVLVVTRGAHLTSSLFFVQDGAMISRVDLQLPPIDHANLLGVDAPFVMVPVTFAELDLSQFRVRDVEERRKQQLQWLIGVYSESLQLLSEAITHLVPMHGNSMLPGILGVSGLTLAGAALLLAPTAALATAGTLGKFLLFGGIAQKTNDHLKARHLEKYARKLLELDFGTIEQPPI